MPVPLRYPVLMPDTPPDIVTEIGKSPDCRRLKEELITGARFQQEYIILRQERINEANRILQSRVIEGLGARIAEIDQEFYFQMIRQYGPECWADPEFLEDTLQRNPGMRIRVHTPPRILVDGFRDKPISNGGAAEISGGRDTRTAFPARVRCIKHSAALHSQEAAA